MKIKYNKSLNEKQLLQLAKRKQLLIEDNDLFEMLNKIINSVYKKGYTDGIKKASTKTRRLKNDQIDLELEMISLKKNPVIDSIF